MTPPLYVPRSAWGAPPTTAAWMPVARGVKIHWIGEKEYRTPDHGRCAEKVRSIRAAHLANKAEGWLDIAYNALVCQHGYVFEGRGIGRRSGANGNADLNIAHYAVCAIMGQYETPTRDLLGGLAAAVAWFRANGAGGELLGHQDGYPTECPGSALMQWVRAGGPTPEGDDGSTPAFPGRDAFGPGRSGGYITLLGQALVRKGYGSHYRVGPGPDWGPADQANVRDFQLAQGWTGDDADGLPGPETWRRLFS